MNHGLPPDLGSPKKPRLGLMFWVATVALVLTASVLAYAIFAGQ